MNWPEPIKTILEKSDLIDLQYGPVEVLTRLQEEVDKMPPELRKHATIEYTHDFDGGFDGTIWVEYRRIETKEERDKREELEKHCRQKANERLEKEELEMLMRLKAKYEGVK